MFLKLLNMNTFKHVSLQSSFVAKYGFLSKLFWWSFCFPCWVLVILLEIWWKFCCWLWHTKPLIESGTALISKLSSYSLYPSLCNFISSFLSYSSVAAVINGHCSKSLSSVVPRGSFLSSTLPIIYHWSSKPHGMATRWSFFTLSVALSQFSPRMKKDPRK